MGVRGVFQAWGRAGFAIVLVAGLAASIAGHAAPLSYQELMARERPVAGKRIHCGAFASQFGELWLPSGAGRHRVVILIHGGCWSARLPGLEIMSYAAEALRQRGHAVWNIEYRRLEEPGAGYPGSG